MQTYCTSSHPCTLSQTYATTAPSNLCLYRDNIEHFQWIFPKHLTKNLCCYACGKLGHSEKNCWQRNYNGHSRLRASLLKAGSSNNRIVTVSSVKCNAAILTGEFAGKNGKNEIIDSASSVSLVISMKWTLSNMINCSICLYTQTDQLLQRGKQTLITRCIPAPINMIQLEITHQFLLWKD